jgi:hypothetical protein
MKPWVKTYAGGKPNYTTPEQEPVGYVSESGKGAYLLVGVGLEDDTPLYTAPPKREWVGLTDEDIDLYAFDEGVTDNKAPAWLVTYARGIEAKLKEKNVPQP